MKNNYYSTRYKFREDRSKVWRAICEYLQQFIPKNSTVLDLGCGYCDFINNIKSKKKIAVDNSKYSSKYCNKNVSFITSKSDSLNKIKNNSVDVVFSSNLFEHLTDKQFSKTLSEIKKILKKNGRLILIQPNYKYSYNDYFDDYTHIKAFSHISLQDGVEAHGFKMTKCIPRFIPFSFKSLLPKNYFLTKIYLHLPIRPMAKQMLLIFKTTL